MEYQKHPTLRYSIEEYLKERDLLGDWHPKTLYKYAQFYELAKLYPKILLIKSVPRTTILANLNYIYKLCESNKKKSS
jgi:hypothetical protein